MGDENHICTLGDYSKPSHEGYMNIIKLPVGNNMVPLRSDTIWLVQNGCLFHGLWSEDPNQQLKDFLKLVDSLDLDGENRERMCPQERSYKIDVATRNDIEKPTGTETGMQVKEAEKKNEAGKEEMIEEPSSQPVEYYLKHSINKKLIERLVDNRISEDILVKVAEHVYPVDFVILDIKEDEKRPFILGTPFLTRAKAVIKFDKGTITLRSGRSKISFHRIHESLCKIERGVKNGIDPIAPIMIVNRLVMEWEERIKLHIKKEMKFDQWKSKNFKSKHHALLKVEGEMNDEGEVT
ncbi:zinc finger, CCHC-type containing protein [Tanacetum coccineum]